MGSPVNLMPSIANIVSYRYPDLILFRGNNRSCYEILKAVPPAIQALYDLKISTDERCFDLPVRKDAFCILLQKSGMKPTEIDKIALLLMWT